MEPRRCRGKNREGKPCGKYPIKGGTVCASHGGAAGQVRAAADRRLAEEEMAASVVTLGLPVDIDPAKALLNEIAVTFGHVQWLRSKVQELTHSDLVWGKDKHEDGTGPQGPVDVTTEKAGPNVWYSLYMQEREHLVKVSTAALRAGIEERKIKLAEDQGNLVAAVIDRILSGILGWLATALPQDALELVQGNWSGMVHEIVPRELRALAALD